MPQDRSAVPPAIRPPASGPSAEPSPLHLLGYSGAFDAAWYLKTNPDLARLGSGALRHYHEHGWREGRKPNAFFDPVWYLAQNRDVTGDPLLHYVTAGEREGRRPIAWFDPAWYARTYRVPEGMLALAHYLLNRHRQALRPIPEFDPAFYLKAYPDVAAAGIDPLEHYMIQGFREARRPFEGFDPVYYRKNFLRHAPQANPLLHYLENRHRPGVSPASPPDVPTVFREVRRRSRPGPSFENTRPLPPSAIRRARVLAYYLPQYHAIPENDAWWGEGFTEWTNLARGMPRFVDHYQPRIPRDLGHYTLDGPDILRRQAELAKGAGIEGFVFYFYWFNRKRLLDGPLETLLAHPGIDLPFCLMWANENWSRRWDGSEDDILIAQDYRREDDEALVDCFARHMRDPRYITVAGRPLLMIYRPGAISRAIPDARASFARWRGLFRDRHGLDPLLVMGQAFNDEDPRPFGLDGAVEFPPHKVVGGCALLNESVRMLDEDFSGQIYDYGEIVGNALRQEPPPFPLIRTATPSWDNDARRQDAGLVLHGSTPELFEQWLGGLVAQARAHPFHGEAIVCVNAWNEWAEGAYLEPDQHFGSAYLNAAARACTGFERRERQFRLLLIGHDAFPAGAQRLLLEIGRHLRRAHGADIRFALREGGAMAEEYGALAPVEVLPPAPEDAAARLHALHEEGFRRAILNSAASAPLAEALAEAGIANLFLIHELPNMLRHRGLGESVAQACANAASVVVPAGIVTESLGLSGHPALKVLPQGLYADTVFDPAERAARRASLGLSARDRLVIGAGYADMRKGFDLFLQLCRGLGARARGVWLGDIDPALREALHQDIGQAIASGLLLMPGRVSDVSGWLSAADVFVLTSREDPYPSVVLEALASGLPCIAFEGSGGAPELIGSFRVLGHPGGVVPFGDVSAMARACRELGVRATEPRAALGARARERLRFGPYVEALLGLAFPDLPRVSVVVPSFNYARYLGARLASIFAQTLPVLEIIVLDDASTDESAEVARQTAEEWGRDIRIVANEAPSGSVFRQWRKALEEARGDWIWIAEADDLCEPHFLEHLATALRGRPQAVMAFSDSRAIDARGALLWDSYRPYCAQAAGDLLDHDGYFTGPEFIGACLAERNLILNASAALFRRDALAGAMARCAGDLDRLRIAGDWRVYIELLDRENAGIAYVAEPLNIHRRHDASATHRLDGTAHLDEILFMQELVSARTALTAAQITRREGYRREITGRLVAVNDAENPLSKGKAGGK